MQNTKLDPIIHQMENYLECWKQFNHFLNLGRAKKFSPEDDAQFLELKSVIVQELELILATIEVPFPTKEDIHSLITNAPSLRYLGEMNEGNLRNLESQWHRIYVGWHSILGQLKVRQNQEEAKGGIASVFGKKRKAVA
jgi:hypothetical protein